MERERFTILEHGPGVGIYGCCLILQQSTKIIKMLTLYRVWREGGSGGKIWPSYQAVAKTRQGGELTELMRVATEAVLMPCNAF